MQIIANAQNIVSSAHRGFYIETYEICPHIRLPVAARAGLKCEHLYSVSERCWPCIHTRERKVLSADVYEGTCAWESPIESRILVKLAAIQASTNVAGTGGIVTYVTILSVLRSLGCTSQHLNTNNCA